MVEGKVVKVLLFRSQKCISEKSFAKYNPQKKYMQIHKPFISNTLWYVLSTDFSLVIFSIHTTLLRKDFLFITLKTPHTCPYIINMGYAQAI